MSSSRQVKCCESMSVERRILLVEDSEPLARTYERYLRFESYNVVYAADGAAALQRLENEQFDAVILDLRLPDMHGLGILRRIRAAEGGPSVVVITADGQISTAVEAMRDGAFDFIVKPFNAERLIVTLRNAVDHRHLTEMVDTYRQDFARQNYFGFIGSSPAMQRVYRVIDAAASSDATVFVSGEGGTGKELCVEAIHKGSPRRNRPLIAINCAAIPKDLVESEILGHVKGAFTGAVADRDGAAAAADGGTLFLDEICEMPLDLQAKLLRFVQTGTFTRIGDTRLTTVDVRFVCATNRDPREEVAAGRFREDLYYRLHVIPILLPPMHERGADILSMAKQFLTEYARAEGKRFAEFSHQAAQDLLAYSWPGNVRELQNLIRNVVVLNDGDEVTVEMLGLEKLSSDLKALSPPPRDGPDALPATDPDQRKNGEALDVVLGPLWNMERQCIEFALDATGGNIPRAAAMLEISPSTIYRKRQAWRALNGS